MPTYAYRCRKCGLTFDRVQKISDPSGARCPRCRAAAERMITGGGGLLFKGGGFYITDYRSEIYKQAAKAQSSPEGGAGQPGKADAGPSAEKGESKEAGSAKSPAAPPARKPKAEEGKSKGGASGNPER